ncbi:MAG: hypothetical protein RLZZ500_1383 [Bacteroidota bacterium]|jgi:hypothetical protein
MKKVLLFVLVAFASQTQAQIAVTRHDNTPISNGQVIAFNTIDYPQAELDFYVKNLSTSSVNVRINCMTLTNNDGAGFELCFANECLSFVEEGNNYPVNLPYLTLAPGGQSGNDGHFLNTLAGAAPFPKDYTFRFFQAGNPTGNTVDVTYRYDPALSTEDIQQLQESGVLIKATTITNELTLDVLKTSTIEVFDFNGKLVAKQDLPYGIQTLDTTSWNTGVYILQFTDAYGNRASKKIIKG